MLDEDFEEMDGVVSDENEESNEDDADRGDAIVEEEESEEVEEEEGSEEESEEEPSEEAETSSKKSIKVPKSRLDEVIAQREEARKRIEDAENRSLWLEEQLEKLINQSITPKETKVEKPADPPYDYDTAEEKYIALVIEGEVAKATKLRQEINAARQKETLSLIQQIKESALESSKTESTKAIEDRAFGTLVSNMESKYQFLDSKSESYNEEAVDTVNTLLKGYVASGVSKTEALKKAISKVVPMYVKEPKPTKPSLGKERTTEAGKKAADAARKQPVIKSSSSTTSKPPVTSVAKLSDKEFSALTDREKRILRGD